MPSQAFPSSKAVGRVIVGLLLLLGLVIVGLFLRQNRIEKELWDRMAYQENTEPFSALATGKFDLPKAVSKGYFVSGKESLPGLDLPLETKEALKRAFTWKNLIALTFVDAAKSKSLTIYRDPSIEYHLPKCKKSEVSKERPVLLSADGTIAFSQLRGPEQEVLNLTMRAVDRESADAASRDQVQSRFLICFLYVGDATLPRYWANFVAAGMLFVGFLFAARILSKEPKDVLADGSELRRKHSISVVNSRFIQGCIWALGILAVRYLLFVIAHLQVVAISDQFFLSRVAGIVRQVSPENIPFAIACAALYVPEFIRRIRPLPLIVAVSAVHIALVAPLMVLVHQSPDGPAGFYLQLYSAVLLAAMGVGLAIRSRSVSERYRGGEPFPFQLVTVLLLILFPLYGLFQLLGQSHMVMPFDYYWTVFLLKGACFGGTLVYIYFDVVSIQFRLASDAEMTWNRRARLLDGLFELQNRRCTVFLDAKGILTDLPPHAKDLLSVDGAKNGEPVNIEDLLADPQEVAFFRQLLRRTPAPRGFFLRFRPRIGLRGAEPTGPTILICDLIDLHLDGTRGADYCLDMLNVDSRHLTLITKRFSAHRAIALAEEALVYLDKATLRLTEAGALPGGSYLEKIKGCISDLSGRLKEADDSATKSAAALLGEDFTDAGEMVLDFARRTSLDDIQLRIGAVPSGLKVRFNGTYLSDALSELINNIRKKQKREKRREASVAIDVTACEDTVDITVTDNGSPFDKEALENFAKRVSPLSLNDHVGLATIRQWAELFGASLFVDNLSDLKEWSSSEASPRSVPRVTLQMVRIQN